MREIKITINKTTGEMVVEGMGYRGTQCVKDIDELMALIGADIISQTAKPEYTQEISQQRIRGR